MTSAIGFLANPECTFSDAPALLSGCDAILYLMHTPPVLKRQIVNNIEQLAGLIARTVQEKYDYRRTGMWSAGLIYQELY